MSVLQQAASPCLPMALLMGALPAAAGVSTWRGGGLTLMLTLFCVQPPLSVLSSVLKKGRLWSASSSLSRHRSLN